MMSAARPPSLWRNRSFVILFTAQIISLVGSGATTIGLALFAYRMAGAGAATAVLGNALTLRILAFLLFSQPAGVLADRTNRKAILIVSDLLRAALLLALPFATALWHIYALIFLLNAVTAFFTPTYEASVPAVVGEAHLVQALSLSRVAVDVEAVAAPAAAAIIVALVGAQWVFWFDAFTYLASASLVTFAAVPGPRRVIRRFPDGARRVPPRGSASPAPDREERARTVTAVLHGVSPLQRSSMPMRPGKPADASRRRVRAWHAWCCSGRHGSSTYREDARPRRARGAPRSGCVHAFAHACRATDDVERSG